MKCERCLRETPPKLLRRFKIGYLGRWECPKCFARSQQENREYHQDQGRRA